MITNADCGKSVLLFCLVTKKWVKPVYDWRISQVNTITNIVTISCNNPELIQNDYIVKTNEIKVVDDLASVKCFKSIDELISSTYDI